MTSNIVTTLALLGSIGLAHAQSGFGNIPPQTVLGNSGTAAAPAQANTLIKMFAVPGADPTGGADSTMAIQAAITAAGLASVGNGGTTEVVLPCGLFTISATLTFNVSNVRLSGCGGDGDHNVTSPQNGTVIRAAAGLSGLPMVLFQTPNGQPMRFGGGLRDLKLDCADVAKYCLQLSSWDFGHFERLTFFNPAGTGSAALFTNVNGASELDGVQMNRFSRISIRTVDSPTAGASAVILNGSATANTSFNTFESIDGLVRDGPCTDLVLADNNIFNNIRCAAIGTGRGMIFRASSIAGMTFGGANGNYVIGVSPGSNGVLSEGSASGTFPAIENLIAMYDVTNGAPLPTVQSGSQLTWQASTGQTDKNTVITYTPTLTCGSGTLTSATAIGEYTVNYKTVTVQYLIVITTNGTCAGNLQAALPIANNSTFPATGAGAEFANTGKGVNGIAPASASAITVRFADGTYPGANGNVISLHAVYQVQ
jgi:hypothetical protein